MLLTRTVSDSFGVFGAMNQSVAEICWQIAHSTAAHFMPNFGRHGGVEKTFY
jgi:hypothetical protein